MVVDPSEKSKDTFCLFRDVGNVGSPFIVFRECDAKVGVTGNSFEAGIVEGVEEDGCTLDAENVALPGVEAHTPGVRPGFEVFQVLL